VTLIKTSALSALAVVAKLVSALTLNKVLALFLGPQGFALIGQLQSAMSAITSVASASLGIGVTKYTAQYRDNEEAQRRLWATAVRIALLSSLATAAATFVLSDSLSRWLFASREYSNVFVCAASMSTLFALNILFLAILNGKKEIARYVAANIVSSIAAVPFIYIFVASWGLFGALIGVATNQVLSFLATIVVIAKRPWFHFDTLIAGWDRGAARKLAQFMLMGLVTAIVVPLSHILVRNDLGIRFGWEAAGYWQGVWKISEAYLMVVTGTLSVYYLPRLSEIVDAKVLRVEIMRGYQYLLPLGAIGATTIYIFRRWIVANLFSAEFEPMEVLFGWQLIGDMLRIGSLLMAYLMLSNAMTKAYVFTEAGFSASFVALAIVLTRLYGLPGVTMAYALNYALYWAVVAALVHPHLFPSRPSG
jgi:PST family polysaccharide transporter